MYRSYNLPWHGRIYELLTEYSRLAIYDIPMPRTANYTQCYVLTAIPTSLESTELATSTFIVGVTLIYAQKFVIF